ncbi:MAG: cation:proton antiporter [Alphaproteobacteria bacterium]
MTLFNILAILLCLSATFSYLNYRYLHFPTTIGLMFIALSMSLCLLALGRLGIPVDRDAEILLRSVDFNQALMHGMLGFLLFAGSLHIDLGDLAREKWSVSVFAVGSVIASMFIVGLLTWWALNLLGVAIPLTSCLLFGALISPTDPVAVIGILRNSGAPKSLEIKIAGESLFNDGIGVVLFLVLLEQANGSRELGVISVVLLFFKETLGGALFGGLAGWAAYCALKSIDNYHVELLITLALVTGGYAAAETLAISGPIAVVVAGLMIGNHGRLFAMSDTTREHLDAFWELVDEILNAVLFVLIGLEVLVLAFTANYLVAGIVAVIIVLLARYVSVGLPIGLMRPFVPLSRHIATIMTWGGLRGGISVAMALSLPPDQSRNVIVAMTYAVVVFSILVQGSTFGRVVRALS